jgi:hypothetical protein
MVPAKIPNTKRSYNTDEISKDCTDGDLTYFAAQKRCVTMFPSSDREAVMKFKGYLTTTREKYLKVPGYDDSIKSSVVKG